MRGGGVVLTSPGSVLFIVVSYLPPDKPLASLYAYVTGNLSQAHSHIILQASSRVIIKELHSIDHDTSLDSYPSSR